MAADVRPIIEMKGINKIFPGVHALKDVDFTIYPGEVRGLVGENGAGKSTLMNVLGGVIPPNSGTIMFDGKKITIASTKKAEELGISFIHQELSLFSNMDIASNIYIHHMPKKYGLLNKKKLFADTKEILKVLQLDRRPSKQVGALKIGEQQLVEIGRSLAQKTRVLVLDEPTSSLTKPEVRILFSLIKSLKEKGVAVIFITHRLEEIYDVCDNITIMRDGAVIQTSKLSEIERSEIITKMIGTTIKEFYSQKFTNPGEELIAVNNICRKDKLSNVSFNVRRGEIVGIYGLMGSGRTEILRSIFGLDKIDSGQILVKGKPGNIKRPMDAIKKGIALVTEDRHLEGLVLGESVKYNIPLANLPSISINKFFVKKDKEAKIAEESVANLKIKTPTIKRVVRFLSGGNQQKVVIAKWLNTNPSLLIMDEPTRGIDVGAKHELYVIMEELVKQGVGILLVSSELPEMIGVCNRVIVLKEGEVKASLSDEEVNSENLLSAAMGV